MSIKKKEKRRGSARWAHRYPRRYADTVTGRRVLLTGGGRPPRSTSVFPCLRVGHCAKHVEFERGNSKRAFVPSLADEGEATAPGAVGSG